MKKGLVSLDTLRVNVKYPKNDVYNYWDRFKGDADSRTLKQGIIAEDFIIRSGTPGYPFSLWKHDARIYLTKETDDIRGEGKGMGILVQLGPKFIIEHITELVTAIESLLSKRVISCCSFILASFLLSKASLP